MSISKSCWTSVNSLNSRKKKGGTRKISPKEVAANYTEVMQQKRRMLSINIRDQTPVMHVLSQRHLIIRWKGKKMCVNLPIGPLLQERLLLKKLRQSWSSAMVPLRKISPRFSRVVNNRLSWPMKNHHNRLFRFGMKRNINSPVINLKIRAKRKLKSVNNYRKMILPVTSGKVWSSSNL